MVSNCCKRVDLSMVPKKLPIGSCLHYQAIRIVWRPILKFTMPNFWTVIFEALVLQGTTSMLPVLIRESVYLNFYPMVSALIKRVVMASSIILWVINVFLLRETPVRVAWGVSMSRSLKNNDISDSQWCDDSPHVVSSIGFHCAVLQMIILVIHWIILIKIKRYSLITASCILLSYFQKGLLLRMRHLGSFAPTSHFRWLPLLNIRLNYAFLPWQSRSTLNWIT